MSQDKFGNLWGPTNPEMFADWIDDCKKYRGKVLTGQYGHWCMEWDQLPVDETCPEWPCGCTIHVKVTA